jgi:hypothetical protein
MIDDSKKSCQWTCYDFFFQIHYCLPRGTEPHVELRDRVQIILLVYGVNMDPNNSAFNLQSFHFRCATPTTVGSVCSTDTRVGFLSLVGSPAGGRGGGRVGRASSLGPLCFFALGVARGIRLSPLLSRRRVENRRGCRRGGVEWRSENVLSVLFGGLAGSRRGGQRSGLRFDLHECDADFQVVGISIG